MALWPASARGRRWPVPDSQDVRKKRSRRGGGSLFRKGRNWGIQYYRLDTDTDRSMRIREYTKQPSRAVAQDLLNQRLGQLARGERFETGKKTTVATLYANLRIATQNNSDSRDTNRKLSGMGWRWKHLKPFFGHVLAVNVTSALIEEYKRERLKAGAANATINRELATLRRTFHYGQQSTPPTVHNIPHIAMLRENNVRTGFVEPAMLDRMAAEAVKDGLWMRLLVQAAGVYGWRRGELVNLHARHVDLVGRTLRLDPGTTKNRKGREVSIDDPVLLELFQAACRGKGPDDPVFTRDDGAPVKDFRGAWHNLCIRAGVGEYRCAGCNAAWTSTRCDCGSRRRKYKGLIVHDMRRSAARNLRSAGVPENVIMHIGGWKTRSMFDRYAIVNPDDTRRALEALAAARQPVISPPFSPRQENPGVSQTEEKGGLIQ